MKNDLIYIIYYLFNEKYKYTAVNLIDKIKIITLNEEECKSEEIIIIFKLLYN